MRNGVSCEPRRSRKPLVSVTTIGASSRTRAIPASCASNCETVSLYRSAPADEKPLSAGSRSYTSWKSSEMTRISTPTGMPLPSHVLGECGLAPHGRRAPRRRHRHDLLVSPERREDPGDGVEILVD